MAPVELLQKGGDGNFLRAVAEEVLQILMEADVEGLIGAGRHERSAERLNYRNGRICGSTPPTPRSDGGRIVSLDANAFPRRRISSTKGTRPVSS